jgi:hypothetical protein
MEYTYTRPSIPFNFARCSAKAASPSLPPEITEIQNTILHSYPNPHLSDKNISNIIRQSLDKGY